MDAMERLLGVRKPMIAAVALLGLPGRPRHDAAAGMERIVEVAAQEVGLLQAGGVDALLFVNEHDLPYSASAGPEVVAAMAAVIGRLQPAIRIPFGVDVLWDARAGLALARATGARFARGVFAGVFDSGMGLLERDWGELAGYRHQIGADGVAALTYLAPEYSASIAGRSLVERARSAAAQQIDGIVVTSGFVGTSPQLADLEAVRLAAAPVPVLATTGVVPENVAEIWAACDGAIVGSALREGSSVFNPVDPTRVARMVELVRAARARQAAAV